MRTGRCPDRSGLKQRSLIGSDLLSKYPMWFLKGQFLEYHSWHHTGSTFNETIFCCIDGVKVDMYLADPCKLDENFKQAKIDRFMEQREQATKNMRKALIVYEEWEGSSRHGRYVKHEKNCLIVDNWAYFPVWGGIHEWSNTYKRKQIDGKHVLSIEYFDRAPRGTAHYFRALEKMVTRKGSKRR